MREIKTHRNNIPSSAQESVTVVAVDDKDPKDGASHEYKLEVDPSPSRGPVGWLGFKHGPSGDPESRPGVTDAAVLAVLIDRYTGFQEGPFRCRENAIVLTHLEEAMHWIHHRERNRAERGVLGTRSA